MSERLEDRISALLSNPGSEFATQQKAFQRLIQDVAREHALVIISPHHWRGMPIDSDALAFAAAVLRGLRLETERAGRELVLTDDPADATSKDGPLTVCIMAASRDHYGFDAVDHQCLGFLEDIKPKALIAGDAVFPTLGDYRFNGPSSFDRLALVDHHRWAQHTTRLKAIASSEIAIINTHFLLPTEDEPGTDALSTGALVARLLDEPDDPTLHLLAQLSILGNGYASEHTDLIGALDRHQAELVIRQLNDFGTYIATAISRDRPRWRAMQRSSIREMVSLLAECDDLARLKRALAHHSLAGTTLGYLTWREALAVEVDRTVAEFRASDQPVFVANVQMPLENALLVHRLAYRRLRNGGLTGRVFMHVGYDDEDFALIAARGEEPASVNLQELCAVNPLGDDWGGGHPERAGFNTMGLDDRQRERFLGWCGGSLSQSKVLAWFTRKVRAAMG